jgi:hypothetical protein
MNDLLPKLPKGLQEALIRYHSAPQPSEEFAARLETQLRQKMSQIQNAQNNAERKTFMHTLRARPFMAILIVLLVLLPLSGVAYALNRTLGYIPGIGIVNQSAPIRVLAEPVVAQRDGLTVTVSEVVADSDHTFVAYTVDGIIIPATAQLTCGTLPSLLLPDGSALSILAEDDGGPYGGQVGSTIKLKQTVTYASLRGSVDTATLTFPCILPKGTGPEIWQIPLTLSPAPKDYATPAFEVSVTSVSSIPAIPSNPTPTLDMRVTPEPVTQSSVPTPTFALRSGLHLDKVIELPGSYVLIGNFTDAQELPGPVEMSTSPYDDLPHIEDEAGNPVAFKVRADMQPEMGPGVRYWAFEIAKPVLGLLKITLDQVNIAVTDTTQFTYNAGADPQVGQKWEINLPVHLRSYDYVIDSLEAVKGGYLFKYHSGLDTPAGVGLSINILGVSLDQQNNMQDNGSEVDGKTIREYSNRIVYPAPLPTGQITVELSLTESVPLQGPWVLTWTPPGK